MIDEIRRILLEAVVPWFMNWSGKRQKRADLKKKSKEYKQTLEYVEQKEQNELELTEYDTFDDYLEMIITFGYVTLFASAFPLASFISTIFIYFEARLDIFKLEKVMKRPRVKKAYNIGSWIWVLEFMAFTSIFTNIILFTYASDQLDHLLPFLSREHSGVSTVRLVVGVFTIEHIMLVIVVLLRVLLDKDPAWVRLFKKRQDYHKEVKVEKQQLEARQALFKAKITTQLLKGNSLLKENSSAK